MDFIQRRRDFRFVFLSSGIEVVRGQTASVLGALAPKRSGFVRNSSKVVTPVSLMTKGMKFSRDALPIQLNFKASKRAVFPPGDSV